MEMMHSNRYAPPSVSTAKRLTGGRVLMATAALLLIALLLLGLSIFQTRRPAAAGIQNGFLLQPGEKPFYAAAGNGLAAATTEHLQLFSQTGKCVARADVAMRSPVCVGSPVAGIYYDTGAPGLYALYPDGSCRTADTDGAVTFADVNENGLVTVLLEKDDTLGTVLVLDTDLTPLFRWEAGTAYPISARTSRNDLLCVCCVSREGSTLRFFRIDREAEQARFTLPEELIIDFGFLSDGTVAAVTDSQLMLLDTEGNTVAVHSFGGSHLNAWSLRGDFAVLATVSGFSGGSAVLTTLNAGGQLLGSSNAPRNVEAISTGADAVLALFTGEESTLFNAALEEQVSYQPEDDVTQVFLTPGGMAFFAGASGVTQIDFN